MKKKCLCTDDWNIDQGGQKDALLREANVKKKKPSPGSVFACWLKNGEKIQLGQKTTKNHKNQSHFYQSRCQITNYVTNSLYETTEWNIIDHRSWSKRCPTLVVTLGDVVLESDCSLLTRLRHMLNEKQVIFNTYFVMTKMQLNIISQYFILLCVNN